MKFIAPAAAGLMVVAALALDVAIAAPAHATVFRFDTDPFAGSTANPNDGVRTIVHAVDNQERFINNFSTADGLFSFDPKFFNVDNKISFFNGLAANIPTDGGVNVVVLQETPAVFAAGGAANLIANTITEDGAGFFIYFNTNVHAPRLVFSTNLNDNTADLVVLARMTNLEILDNDPLKIREELSTFTAENFALVPEPSTLSLLLGAGLAVGATFTRRRRTRAAHAGA